LLPDWFLIAFWLLSGWLLVGFWLVSVWFLVGFWLVSGCFLVGFWLVSGCFPVGVLWFAVGIRFVVGWLPACSRELRILPHAFSLQFHIKHNKEIVPESSGSSLLRFPGNFLFETIREAFPRAPDPPSCVGMQFLMTNCFATGTP